MHLLAEYNLDNKKQRERFSIQYELYLNSAYSIKRRGHLHYFTAVSHFEKRCHFKFMSKYEKYECNLSACTKMIDAAAL